MKKYQVKEICDKMIEKMSWIDREVSSELIEKLKVYRDQLLDYSESYVEDTMTVFPLDPRINLQATIYSKTGEYMAHFAQLNENNIVIQVIVVDNAHTATEDGVENENIGVQFCRNLLGNDTKWKQTSYNATFRKNYAGIGYRYDEILDAFIPPKPFNSWLLNEDTCHWYAPKPYPDDGQSYNWDEDSLNWIPIV